MSVVTLFSGLFCNESMVVRDMVKSTGLCLITDDMVIANASELSRIPVDKLKEALCARTSVFNTFTFEKERSIAYLKLALAKMITDESFLISGYTGLLIPKAVTHVLRVCLIAKLDFRLNRAQTVHHLSHDEAIRVIQLDDHNRCAWTTMLFDKDDPWDPASYDIVLPMGKTIPEKACAIIEENLLNDVVKKTDDSKAALNDFHTAAKACVALIDAGHNVGVQSKDKALVLTINKQVLMLNRLEDELISIAKHISGVESVEIRIAETPAPSPVYRKHTPRIPSKILLVDDEREFVQTLSERLQMRDMGTVVAYDGESALDLVRDDDPEVMILDLKMPGIDGMKVLEEVKRIRPQIEVIILTGHGSEKDKEKCMNMGAFAYLQKPADINFLSDTLKKAHEKTSSHNLS